MKQLFRSVHECTIENGWEFFFYSVSVSFVCTRGMCVFVCVCVCMWNGREGIIYNWLAGWHFFVVRLIVRCQAHWLALTEMMTMTKIIEIGLGEKSMHTHARSHHILLPVVYVCNVISLMPFQFCNNQTQNQTHSRTYE